MKVADRTQLLAWVLAFATLVAAGAEKGAQPPPQQVESIEHGAAQQPKAAPQALAPRPTTIAPQPAQAPPAPSQQQQPKRTQPRTQQAVPQPATQGAPQQLPPPVPPKRSGAMPQAPVATKPEPEQLRAAARGAGGGYAVNARVFLASTPEKVSGGVGTAELAQEEKNLCTYIPYKHYKLAKSGSKTLKSDDTLTVDIDRNYSVSVKPLSDTGGKVTARIVWRTPNGRTWTKTLSFTRGVQSMVGGPNVDGGIYLLSLMIR